jgi:hypothetical protein
MSSVELNMFDEYLNKKSGGFMRQTCYQQLEKFTDANIGDKKLFFENCMKKSDILLERLYGTPTNTH